MSSTEPPLELERALKNRDDARFGKYQTLKREILTNDYIFTLHRFPGGNDHGPEHIKRVLEYLDKLARERLDKLSTLEIYLLLGAAVLHDQGMMQGRAGHQLVPQNFLSSHDYRFFFEAREADIVGQIIRLHSSNEKIEKEFPEPDGDRSLGGEPMRPRYLSAMLRLADELDEDFRRSKARIFDHMNLPKASQIYWLRNSAIESVDPRCAEQRIIIRATLDEADASTLYPFGGRMVNVPAAVLATVRKINEQRRYCSGFLEDGLQLRSVEFIASRPGTKDALRFTLDDHNDGGTFETEHPGLFRSRSESTTSGVGEEKPAKVSSVVRSWDELSSQERGSLPDELKQFAKDAEEVVANPHHYGVWRLEVRRTEFDMSVTLCTQLFLSDRDTDVRIEVFPVGHYPLKAPGIASVPTDSKLDERLRASLASVLMPQVWNSKYRPLDSHRLVHLADTLAYQQDRSKLFRAWAKPVLAIGDGWQLVDKEGRPTLVRTIALQGTNSELTVQQPAMFPTEVPCVKCRPAPATRHWLGTGEINKDTYGRTQWREALRRPEPLCELAGALQKLATM